MHQLQLLYAVGLHVWNTHFCVPTFMTSSHYTKAKDLQLSKYNQLRILMISVFTWFMKILHHVSYQNLTGYLINILIKWRSINYQPWFAELRRSSFLSKFFCLQSFHLRKNPSCSVTLRAEDINHTISRTLSSAMWHHVLWKKFSTASEEPPAKIFSEKINLCLNM
jgi:hypothetical protein